MDLGWVSDIPATWELRKLKAAFVLRKRPVRAGDETVTAFRDGQVTLRRNRRLAGFTEAEKEIGYQGIRRGDLVIHNMDAFAGAIGVSDSEGKSTPVYSVCTPSEGASSEYFALLLRHLAVTGHVEALARGIRERSTDFRWNTAKEVVVPFPPLEEQGAIVRFLREETGKIDAFIRDQEELIGLLQERRAATISHAITEGLDASAPVANTQSPWFPSLPAHWDLLPIGLGAELIQTGPFGSQLHSDEYVSGGVPLVNPMHLIDGQIKTSDFMTVTETKAVELARHALRVGDVVVARRGELGRSAVTTRKSAGALCGTGSAIVRLAPGRLDPNYFQLVFSSTQNRDALSQYSVGSTMDNLNANLVGRMRIPCPPIAEQGAIVEYLRHEAGEIDAAISDAREGIALSRERRSALISAAVTGKIDVQEYVRGVTGEHSA